MYTAAELASIDLYVYETLLKEHSSTLDHHENKAKATFWINQEIYDYNNKDREIVNITAMCKGTKGIARYQPEDRNFFNVRLSG